MELNDPYNTQLIIGMRKLRRIFRATAQAVEGETNFSTLSTSAADVRQFDIISAAPFKRAPIGIR